MPAFAMRENNAMRLPWYDSPTAQRWGGVGLSHRGSRRINGKFVVHLGSFVFSVYPHLI